MAVQAGNIQFQIDFTREHEKEADRVGMQTLSLANFDPRSMPSFFERLQQSTRYYGKGVPEFLRTHPMSENRVADTRGRAEAYPYRQYPDTVGYLLAKTKLAVLTESDKRINIQHFSALLQQGTPLQRAIAQYGLGLVELESLRFDTASPIFQKLSEQYPEQPQYLTALARTASEAKQYDKAHAIFAKAVRKFPNNDAIKIEFTRSLMKNGQAQQAKEMLLSLSDSQKNQPFYYESWPSCLLN